VTAAKAGGPPPLDAARSWLGAVVALDAPRNSARVAFAPGVFGEVALADVAWARRRDVEHESVPRSRIDQVFAVGDVARFRVLPHDAQAPPPDAGDPEGTVPGSSASEAPAASEPSPHRPAARGAAPALRLTLDQSPQVEGALLSLDIASGEVLALVGGYDYGRSQFDRAVQARRQPGSAFKPFIYATALQRGFSAVTTVYDTPVVYTNPETGEVWKPENYDGKFLGAVPLREALARSLNNATIHVLFDVGIHPVIDMARRLGVRSPLAPYPSIALGTSPVSLVELTSAYAAFPAGGRRVEPVFIRRVLDREGKLLLENVRLDAPEADDQTPPSDAPGAAAPGLQLAGTSAGDSGAPDPKQVLPPALAFLVTDLLRAPIEHPHGTGRKAKALGRPLAGKTGTTNDQGDAWFVGFSPDLVAGVWVGFDERQVLGKGETGGHAALPIWIDYMRDALADRPVRDFPVPTGVSYARIDPSTGKLADGASHDAYFQSFLEGHEPNQSTGETPSESDSRRLMRMDF
jgi:penicillin-binding protein 1A